MIWVFFTQILRDIFSAYGHGNEQTASHHSRILQVKYIILSCPFWWFLQKKERAEQVAYKLEQDLAMCEYHKTIAMLSHYSLLF